MNVDRFGRFRYTGTTIDKFGRHASTERVRGPKGEGFKLTADGSYDIENKRLANVSDPMLESDGVNLKTVQKHVDTCIKLTDNKEMFDALQKRIGNVADPQQSSDLITKVYLESRTPIKLDEYQSYSVHQYKLQDLGTPEYDGDAVTVRYLNKNALIRHDKTWDCKNIRLINVGRPEEDGDSVNKAYFQSHTPVRSKKGWNFSNARLLMTGFPEDAKDAVNLEYMQTNSMIKAKDNSFDAKSCRISNLAKPQNVDDAVSKRYLKTVISDLGYEIYKSIHSKKQSRSRLVPAEEWKSKVLDSTWEELFNS